MDWVTLLSIVLVAISTIAGSEWMTRDRERSKLERDVAMYQKDLPMTAKRWLGQAIDHRAFTLYHHEKVENFAALGLRP